MRRIKTYWKELDVSKKRIIKPMLGILAGAALGYGYYATIGCSTGACPITGNPVISTLWGAAIGGFAAAG
jgi:outer membrane lipoprotein SlyB